MKAKKFSLRDVGAFSSMFLDYLESHKSLDQFYRFSPAIENFKNIIEERTFPDHNRNVLYDVITEQYAQLEKSEKTLENIFALQDNKTFTVTTGHQLNIFTGPLYFIFKIVTTINLARRLKETYPAYNFVPLYWMASEDHDFEEINNFNLFGKKYTWETKQKGAVGRFAPQGLNVLLEQLPDTLAIFEKAYLDSSTLSDAVRYYVNELFGKFGLLVINADNSLLKSLFKETIKDDIINQKANGIVEATNLQLNEAGFKSQAFSRKINFFYLNGYRERIIEENGIYKVNNSDINFTQEELLKKIDEEPERFSPNVIMRPLYQEVVLPNLAYIGGPAEMIYWLQLKGVFNHYEVSFPILIPRNFGMVIGKNFQKKIEKLQLNDNDLFKDNHDLKAAYISKHTNNEHLLDDEKESLINVFNEIKLKAGQIDKSLEGYIGSENAKAIKALENVEKKLKKAQELQNEIAMTQIDAIKEKLFPEGGLQERHDNFLNFYLNNPQFIQELIDHFDPLDYSFYQFWEE